MLSIDLHTKRCSIIRVKGTTEVRNRLIDKICYFLSCIIERNSTL